MRFVKVAFVSVVLLLLATLAVAQTEYPKAELGMGYSLVRMSTTGVLEQFTQNGASANLAYNFNSKIGFLMDLGGYNNNNIRGYDVDNTMFTYLFGPKFTARGSKVNVFGEALFGGAHISGSASSNFGGTTTTVRHVEESNNSAAFLIGGGFDVNVSRNIAIRPAQFDYLLIRFNPGNQSETQNNMRYSAGIVFRFGHTQ